ncbi:MAG: LacI family DNA-binding transcriptional regulator [Victivallaceae bacterium]|nr:LacI family DNA-binding transcriptional regulator [Victivallaceae bacterium]
MPPSGKIGLKEIARVAGVSAMTVSSVLKGTGRISDAKRHEIQEIARKMRYHSNAAGRLLKSKRIEDLGLLIFESEALIRENAAFQAYNILFTRQCRDLKVPCRQEWFDPARHPDSLPLLLTDGLVGGLLIAGVMPEAALDYLRNSAKIPYVQLGEVAEYSVSYAATESLNRAVEHLLSLGHKAFAIVAGPDSLPAHANFRRLITEKLLPHGTVVAAVDDPRGNFRDELIRAADAVLFAPSGPTAVFCASGVVAKALTGEFFRRGLRVPEDLSVIAYETADWEAREFSPALTAIEYDYVPLIEHSLAMLRTLVADEPLSDRQLFFDPVFTVRESTGKAKAR